MWSSKAFDGMLQKFNDTVFNKGEKTDSPNKSTAKLKSAKYNSVINKDAERSNSLTNHKYTNQTEVSSETSSTLIDEFDALLGELSENDELDSLEERRNDREEIRRKLAMDSDSEEYYCGERVTRKPSLTTRLQSGMNLQICFMNETASDLDSQGSDQDSENGNPSSNKESPTDQRTPTLLDQTVQHSNEVADITRNGEVPNQNKISSSNRNSICSTASGDSDTSSGPWKLQHPLVEENHPPQQQKVSETKEQPTTKRQRPSFFFSRQKSWRLGQLRSSQKKQENQSPPVQKRAPVPLEEDFLTRHARLQAEARHALSQAKEMARMQMEVERQRKKKSPIADIVGIPFSDGRHRLTRQLLTDMNVAQLQVIVNDLHSQIESLNEDLVRLLLERDDLNMEQDSMLVDIEDMTRFLGAKEEALKTQICPKMGGLK